MSLGGKSNPQVLKTILSPSSADKAKPKRENDAKFDWTSYLFDSDDEAIDEPTPGTSSEYSGVKLPLSLVQMCAQQAGVMLPEKVMQMLSENTTAVLRNIVEEAKTRAHLSNRTVLMPSDIASVLGDYGYPVLFLSLEKHSKVMLQCVASIEPHQYEKVTISGVGVDNIYAQSDTVVDVDTLAKSPELEVPAGIYLKPSWILLDGSVPATDDNEGITVLEDSAGTSAEATASERHPSLRETRTHHCEVSTVQQLALHPVPLEMHKLFKAITEAATSSDDRQRQQAARALETDASLGPIVSDFVTWYTTGVYMNIGGLNLAMLIYLTQFMHALAQNSHIDLRAHYNRLIPAIMSTVFADQLSQRTADESHWSLRDYAGKLLLTVARRDEETLASIVVYARRIYRMPNMHDAVKLYSAVQLLAEISSELVRGVIIPGARRIGARIEHQRRRGDIDNAERLSYERLYKVLVVRCASYLSAHTFDTLNSIDDYRELFGVALGQAINVERLRQIRDSEPEKAIMNYSNAPKSVPTDRQTSSGIAVKSRLPPPQTIAASNSSATTRSATIRAPTLYLNRH